MKKFWLAGVAGVALAVAVPSAMTALTALRPSAPHPALDPLALAQTLCGPSPTGPWRSRRAAFVAAAAAYAADLPSDSAQNGDVRLWSGLGSSTMDITTASDAAQVYFNQGLRFMQGFNHAEAISSFVQAQELDPECAMCFWGEAISYGPNINYVMIADDYPRAHEAAVRAHQLAQSNGSDIERALTRALLYRYEPIAPDDRAKLDEAYSDAMTDVADLFLDNDEIQALAVEAMMDTQPWYYWEADGIATVGNTDDILERLETVLARNPRHAPSIHLYIHMTEASANPWRATPHADRLRGLAPSSGHLVHMPSHIYFRTGRFKDSLEINISAVATDEAMLDVIEGSALYRFGYYPHNVHFALTSAQMAGDAQTALAMAARLDDALPMEMASAAPWVQPIKAAPWFAQAQFGDPQTVIDADGPGADTLPYIVAAWRYARGEAFAKLGRTDEARAEAAAIAQLAATADFTDLIEGFVPALEALEIMTLVVEGRAAAADDDLEAAIVAYQRATDIQSSLAYTEPPYWWYPVRQSLAAALLRAGHPERAELEFYKTLVESPNNGWAYWGMAQAQRALGDRAGARAAERKWRTAWAGQRRGMRLEAL